MDTRTKIITPEAALELARGARPVALITGYFDVLLAAHVRALAGVRERLPEAILLVAVASPEQPLLEVRARAEMVAALGVVDYVVSLDEGQIDRLLAQLPAACVVRLEAAHQQSMRELIEHVQRRQST